MDIKKFAHSSHGIPAGRTRALMIGALLSLGVAISVAGTRAGQ